MTGIPPSSPAQPLRPARRVRGNRHSANTSPHVAQRVRSGSSAATGPHSCQVSHETRCGAGASSAIFCANWGEMDGLAQSLCKGGIRPQPGVRRLTHRRFPAQGPGTAPRHQLSLLFLPFLFGQSTIFSIFTPQPNSG